jgi:cytidine deaminase
MSDDLLDRARDAKARAYCPYSEFAVGAALRTASGDVYTGANIETITLTDTAHAEQVALHRAVFDGCREFDALTISLSGDPTPPCGICRQSLAEFCDDSLAIVVDNLGEFTLGELLPARMESIE